MHVFVALIMTSMVLQMNQIAPQLVMEMETKPVVEDGGILSKKYMVIHL